MARSQHKTQGNAWDLRVVEALVPSVPDSEELCPLGDRVPSSSPGSVSPAVYILLGRVFLLSAVVLAFLAIFLMVSIASEFFLRTRKHNMVSSFISFLTGVHQPGGPCFARGGAQWAFDLWW